MSKAAVYCRVSTEKQEREGTSLESQQVACLARAKELGYQIPPDNVYLETYSGLSLDRPKLDELRELIRIKAIDTVICYSLDRFSRDPVHFILLQDEMERAGCQLILVTETVDSSDMGKLISHIRGFAAKLEAEKIRERSMRGKRTCLDQGNLPTGAGKGVYGYDWVKRQDKTPGHRNINPAEAEIVKRIFSMIAGGIPRIRIAKILNQEHIPTKAGSLWHPITVNRVASNQAYMGVTFYGRTSGSKKSKSLKTTRPETWKSLPNATPAIISEQLFNYVQKVLADTKDLKLGHPEHDYLLTGHVRCAICGERMVGGFMGHKHRYYHCRGNFNTAVKQRTCNAKVIRADGIEPYVWDKIKNLLDKPETILSQIASEFETTKQSGGGNLDRDIVQIEKKIAGYDAQRKKLMELFTIEVFTKDELLDKLSDINTARKSDEGKLAGMIAMRDRLNSYAEAERKLKEYCGKVKRNLDNIDFEHKRLTLDALDITVYAETGKEPQIKWLIPIDIVSSASEAMHGLTNTVITVEK